MEGGGCLQSDMVGEGGCIQSDIQNIHAEMLKYKNQ